MFFYQTSRMCEKINILKKENILIEYSSLTNMFFML